MGKLIDGYYRLLNWLLAATVAILVVPVTMQIVSRFTALIPAWIWTEEMARFLFIWMVMLGAMVGVRDGTHFDVDVWPRAEAARECAAAHRRRSVRARCSRWCSSGTGIKFVQFGWNQTSELADLPMAWIFIAWPMAGLTWLLVPAARRFDRDLRILARSPRGRSR